jgi:magnesium-transporting ATPase (P-type)
MTYSTYLFLEKFGGTQGLLRCLKTQFCAQRKSGVEGIETDLAGITRERVNDYGANVYPKKQVQSLASLVSKQLGDKLMKLLIAASLLALIAQGAALSYQHGFLQGLTILFTVLTITFFSALSEWRCMKNLTRFGDDLGNQSASAYRGKKDTESVTTQELLVGDIIRIDKGMIVPADCILIQAGHPRQASIDKKSKLEKALKSSSEIILLNEKDVTGNDNY